MSRPSFVSYFESLSSPWKHICFITLIALITVLLRSPAVYRSHSGWDEILYSSLALKLEKEGLSGYNLQRLDFQTLKAGEFTRVHYNDNTSKGSLLKNLESGGATYYSDETLSNMPFLYSWMLRMTRAFSGISALMPDEVVLGKRLRRWQDLDQAPEIYPTLHAFALHTNLLLSLLTSLLVYAIGCRCSSKLSGFFAGLLFTMHPVDLMASQRIWADSLLTFFSAVNLAVIVWLCRSRPLLGFSVAGVAAGLSILTKGSGLFLLPFGVALVCLMLFQPRCFRLPSAGRGRFQTPALSLCLYMLFAVGLGLIWHCQVYQHYGTWIYRPDRSGITEKSAWFQMLADRPHTGQLFYFFILSPVMFLFYVRWGSLLGNWRHRTDELIIAFHALAFLIPLTIMGGREERYLLPAYPAIALLTANALVWVYHRAFQISEPPLRWLVVSTISLVFAASLLWGVYRAHVVLENGWSVFAVGVMPANSSPP